MRFAKLTLAAASAVVISQTAFAADIPVRASRAAPAAVAVPVVAPFSWTGCYVGLNAGVGIAENDWDVRGTRFSLGSGDATGAVVGGQVGCDLQTGAFVFGVEGLLDWADLNESHTFRRVLHLHSDMSWFATVTGRAGVTFGPSLVYVRGGAAFTDRDHSFNALGVRASTRGDDTQTGWTVGVGAEWAFAPNWSARIEYNYMDFDSDSPTFCAGGACGRPFNIDERVHTVTLGVNFRFR